MRKKLKEKFADMFGRVPDVLYLSGDMEHIRAYHDFRRENNKDDFFIDDITWNDLSMDDIFKRINSGLSTSGEQYLYHMLRTPTIDEGQYRSRRQMIDLMEQKPDLRLKLQGIFSKLGRTRRADLSAAFHPESHGYGWLLVYLVLLLMLPAALVCFLLSARQGLLALCGVIIVNSAVHEYRIRKVRRDFDTVNYSVTMIFAINRINKLKDPQLDSQLSEAYDSLKKLRFVIRTGGVSDVSDGGIADMFTLVTLIDLIAYEFLKNKFGRYYQDIFTIHESLGRVDASIAIASYRASLDDYALPELDFAQSQKPHIEAVGIVHPLLEEAVANDLVTDRSLLITGSNASGKSTYLKTAVLCALMAQSICSCTAGYYKASAFRIYSSMALSDDLFAGESYFIVETKSLKRIIDAAEANHSVPVLCVVDEVLRGTNTIERIAASAEVLQALAKQGVLCLAATHDIELCDLLENTFMLGHFTENIYADEILFDYRFREGPATSRNAINLLKIIGFDEDIVEKAHQRANRYMKNGVWK